MNRSDVGASRAPGQPLLDIAGVASVLCTSERHVRRLVAERRIPYLKVGHFVRFDRDEIERWIEHCRRPPLSEPAEILARR